MEGRTGRCWVGSDGVCVCVYAHAARHVDRSIAITREGTIMHDVYVYIYVHIYRRTSLAMKTTMSVRFSATFRSASCRVFCFYFLGATRVLLKSDTIRDISGQRPRIQSMARHPTFDSNDPLRKQNTHTHRVTHTRARARILCTHITVYSTWQSSSVMSATWPRQSVVPRP